MSSSRTNSAATDGFLSYVSPELASGLFFCLGTAFVSKRRRFMTKRRIFMTRQDFDFGRANAII